ncbi:hypothetical protein EAF04_000033 [Stromatinia cepivora]|nr:hypothetical protein EAF04_000033 [Stromatinia cepivora]
MDSSTELSDIESADQSETPPPPPGRKFPKFSIRDTLVSLVVGHDGVESRFAVHKRFACHYSPVLKAAFNSDSIEGQTQVYNFEETKHELTFAYLVQWIYTQKIEILVGEEGFVDDSPDATEMETNERVKMDDDALVKLWILADKLLMPECQNYVADRIMARFQHFKIIALECLSYVWDNTAGEETRLQRLFIIQSLEAKFSRQFLLDNMEYFPKPLLCILLGSLFSLQARTEEKLGECQELSPRTYASFHVPDSSGDREGDHFVFAQLAED